MPSNPVHKKAVIAAVGVFVVATLLWGYFIEQQLLLSAYVAVLGSLVIGFLYVAWQYFRGSGANGLSR